MEIRNPEMYRNIVAKVKMGSIADELGIEVGDELLSINEQPVADIIEYKYLLSDQEILVLLKKTNGELIEYEIEKEYDEDLGIEFVNPLIDKARSCSNRCIFCFIDQLPKGLRKTLYFKDDDSRLSFLQGNFITLTNMTEEEIDKIIRYRISPINVSVHTTNPILRVEMLKNKKAGRILEFLRRFSDAGIFMNCQIVLVKNVNDGMELDRTINDLAELYPQVESVAVVPVGLTKYREGLPKLEAFDAFSSKIVVEQISNMQKKYYHDIGTRFVFASDEFFIQSGIEIPAESEYEGYPQLENGVGLIRSFSSELDRELLKIRPTSVRKKILLITGTSAYNFMCNEVQKVKEKINFDQLEVRFVVNHFFGEKITVTGLVTATDIIEQLSDLVGFDKVLIPAVMLRDGEDTFLDDLKISDLEKVFQAKVEVVDISGHEFIKSLLN